MTVKIIVAGVIIVAALAFGAASFVETNVEYADFRMAMTSHKKVQVKGEWLKEQKAWYDAGTGTFNFSMADEHGQEMKVLFDGARPNNFELAQAIVAKGRYENGSFHASEILTKCPSKYEADAESVKKSL
jgi:cytochrome c-type biogenesis protein CcmE